MTRFDFLKDYLNKAREGKGGQLELEIYAFIYFLFLTLVVGRSESSQRLFNSMDRMWRFIQTRHAPLHTPNFHVNKID